MTFNELEIGHCYSRGDDALYKIVDKGSDWVLVLSYSFNHHVTSPWIFNTIDINEDKLHEETNGWETDIFNNLSYVNYDMLKEN